MLSPLWHSLTASETDTKIEQQRQCVVARPLGRDKGWCHVGVAAGNQGAPRLHKLPLEGTVRRVRAQVGLGDALGLLAEIMNFSCSTQRSAASAAAAAADADAPAQRCSDV
jgi:hypothetical protein